MLGSGSGDNGCVAAEGTFIQFKEGNMWAGRVSVSGLTGLIIVCVCMRSVNVYLCMSS